MRWWQGNGVGERRRPIDECAGVVGEGEFRVAVGGCFCEIVCACQEASGRQAIV